MFASVWWCPYRAPLLSCVQVVDHQRDMMGALKTKLEAQHLTLIAVGEQRDAAQAEAATLVRKLPVQCQR